MNNNHSAKIPSIKIGQMAVCLDGRLRTLLGSCVGVALFDLHLRVGGLAHVVLPHSLGKISDSPAKYADLAIPELIHMIDGLVIGKPKLQAKIAGGSNMFGKESRETIGSKNIDSVERLLTQFDIPIVGKHCGGSLGRKMTLDTSNGNVMIDVVGSVKIEI